MTRQKIHEKIIQTLKNFGESVPLIEKHHNFVRLKLMKFEEKLSQLPLKELQNILKNIELISLFQHDEQLHHHLKLLKQHIKNNPKHQYHHLLPIIDYFIQSYTKKKLFVLVEKGTFPKLSKNLINDKEIINLADFCCLIEGAGLLLNEIAYFEIIQVKINQDFWGTIFIILVMLEWIIVCITLLVFCLYHFTLIGIVSDYMSIMLLIAGIGVSIAFLYLIVSEFNEDILLKSNLSNLHECLIQIHLHKRIEEWAVVSLKKLPTEINACIGGFFANAESIEKRLFTKEQAVEQPLQPALTV
jgi:hypothetical protein